MIRKLAFVSLLIFIPFFAILLLKVLIAPSIKISNITTAIVEEGDLQITIQGSGVVIPNYEEMITAPFRSKLLKIIKTPGAVVSRGDTLLILDNAMAVNELNRLQNEMDLIGLKKEKLKNKIREMEEDFDISQQIRVIRIENLKSAYDAEVYLEKLGGSTPEIVKKAKTAWKIGTLELKQAKNNNRNRINESIAEVRELETQIRIQRNAIISANNKVDLAYVKAPFKGNLMSMINQPGAMVSEGQEIARLADLSNYRIKGSMSNTWAGSVMAGQTVLIRSKDMPMTGILETIMPSVNQGMIECMIRLTKANMSKLRPNQQLDIRVVISIKDKVFRLQNGTYYKNAGNKNLYVVQGKKAIRTKILFGEANFDFVEIISGAEIGDEIIITELSEKYDQEELKIK